MTLFEQIKKDKLDAFKHKNSLKKNVLNVLIGDLQNKSKNPSDDECIKTIKKIINGNKETVKLSTDENRINELNVETEYLDIYLPKLFNENELTEIIESHIDACNYNSMKDMGKVMSYLISNFANLYDGKLASQITQKLLK